MNVINLNKSHSDLPFKAFEMTLKEVFDKYNTHSLQRNTKTNQNTKDMVHDIINGRKLFRVIYTCKFANSYEILDGHHMRNVLEENPDLDKAWLIIEYQLKDKIDYESLISEINNVEQPSISWKLRHDRRMIQMYLDMKGLKFDIKEAKNKKLGILSYEAIPKAIIASEKPDIISGIATIKEEIRLCDTSESNLKELTKFMNTLSIVLKECLPETKRNKVLSNCSFVAWASLYQFRKDFDLASLILMFSKHQDIILEAQPGRDKNTFHFWRHIFSFGFKNTSKLRCQTRNILEELGINIAERVAYHG
jgi:hypothetical protein